MVLEIHQVPFLIPGMLISLLHAGAKETSILQDPGFWDDLDMKYNQI
jgi:hypothetical protein